VPGPQRQATDQRGEEHGRVPGRNGAATLEKKQYISII